MNKIERIRKPAGYDEDFVRWTGEQAAFLRAGRFDAVDRENIAEEIEGLGRSYEDEIESRLKVLLLHLLKWKYQPERQSPSWQASIVEQRTRIDKRIRQSPSLKAYPATVLADEYGIARLEAAGETGLQVSAFPLSCPFTISDILDPDFYPQPVD